MKYYTTENYATLKGVDVTTVSKWATQGKIKSVSIAHPLSKIVWEPDNTETSIIGLMNLKGGAGKTTLAAHLAICLSKVGFKVLIIDTDHQNQCKLFFPDQNYDHSIDQILANKIDVKNAIYTVSTQTSKLDIIYSSYGLALFASDYRNLDGFLEMINKIKNDYDFIIVDTSPNFDIINRNVSVSVTHIIVPIIPTNMHLEGLEHQIEALDKIAHVPLNKVIGIIPNIVSNKKVEHPSYIEYLKKEYQELVYENVIPDDPYMEKVSTFNTNIFDYREKSKSSQALKKFVWETLRRI